MREFLVVGLPNSGKTMFTLNFASYVGSKSVDVLFRSYDGIVTCRHFSIEEAKSQLCSTLLHKTRFMQSLILKIALGKIILQFKLTDTCGISPSIHQDENIRRGMSQTLSVLRSVDFIFHIVDASCLATANIATRNTIDHELYHYGILRNGYTILANKIDVPAAKQNMPQLHSLFPRANIIPISALLSQGFKEVKSCVARNI